jgi:transcriptional regulator with XRE-family HTH domain
MVLAPRTEGENNVERIVTPGQLRRLMRKHKLSGAALARLAGTSQPTISRLTSGTTASCRGDVGARIERVFDVTPGSLFGTQGRPAGSAPDKPEGVVGAAGDVAVPPMASESEKSTSREAAA